MKFYYIICSLFFILFFPRVLTNVICFGRHRDQLLVKKKSGYILIYIFWTFFFGIFCLMMGSVAGVDHTFDKIYDSYLLYFTECTYTENKAMKPNDPKSNMFTLEYFVTRNEDDLENVIVQIIEDNKVLCRQYKLDHLQVIASVDRNSYNVYFGKEIITTVAEKKEGLLKKLIFQWNKEKLEHVLQQIE